MASLLQPVAGKVQQPGLTITTTLTPDGGTVIVFNMTPYYIKFTRYRQGMAACFTLGIMLIFIGTVQLSVPNFIGYYSLIFIAIGVLLIGIGIKLMLKYKQLKKVDKEYKRQQLNTVPTNQGIPQPNQPFLQPNQPFLQPNQGYDQPNQGYPQPNQGYAQPNQGYPQPNQGYPQPNQGYPQPNQGYPQPNQAFPPPNMGYPPNQYPNQPPPTYSECNASVSGLNNADLPPKPDK